MKLKKILRSFLIILIIWIAATSGLQRFVCPDKTETQLLLLIPYNVFLIFDECPEPSKHFLKQIDYQCNEYNKY